ncbi:MAG: hypothetical protein OXN83_05195 [Oligoflexia bacterium]|nr:hypothetical protein [Oligoflexia bacterium]
MNKIVFFVLFFLFLSSCNFGGGLSVTYNLPSVGEGSPLSNSEYFYIDLDIDKYEASGDLVPFYEISTTTEYGDAEERDSLSNCEIYYDSTEGDTAEKKAASEGNLICILDLLEYEFFVKDLHLVYNLPGGMCDHIETSLPWHFNAEIRQGPVVEECDLPKEAEEGSDEDEEAEKGFRDASDSDGNCVKEEEDLCPPSYTWIHQGDEPVRCCDGGSKLEGEQWAPDLRCFGGPALIAEMAGHSKERFSRYLVTASPEGGLRGRIKLPSLISNTGGNQLSNSIRGYVGVGSPIANYLKALDRPPDQLNSVSRDSLPDFLQVSPFFEQRPNLFFEFSCLDGAGEILHKVLLMIREWNTYEEFRKFYDAGGENSADPDVDGTEGEDCDYEDFGTLDREVEECNDFLDLDDIINCEDYAWCNWFNIGEKIYPRISYPEGGTFENSGS